MATAYQKRLAAAAVEAAAREQPEADHGYAIGYRPPPEPRPPNASTTSTPNKPRRLTKDALQSENSKCGARTRQGRPCGNRAGYGTDHEGFGNCKHHGGSLPNPRKAGVKQELDRLLGFELDINPVDALLLAVRITAGEVDWITEQLDHVPREEWTQHTIAGYQLNIWAQERIKATERLARFSKMAIDMNIAERQVRMSEQYGITLYRMVRFILDNMDLTPMQKRKAPEVVRQALLNAQGASHSATALIPALAVPGVRAKAPTNAA
jgi:hypothetical protein